MDKNGNWIRLKNIGYPINTDKDEHGLIVSLDGKTAYFTRGDQGVAETGGLNLVSFGLHKKARPEKVVMMKGSLKDENGAPVKNGKISVTDKKTGEVHQWRYLHALTCENPLEDIWFQLVVELVNLHYCL